MERQEGLRSWILKRDLRAWSEDRRVLCECSILLERIAPVVDKPSPQSRDLL